MYLCVNNTHVVPQSCLSHCFVCSNECTFKEWKENWNNVQCYNAHNPANDKWEWIIERCKRQDKKKEKKKIEKSWKKGTCRMLCVPHLTCSKVKTVKFIFLHKLYIHFTMMTRIHSIHLKNTIQCWRRQEWNKSS